MQKLLSYFFIVLLVYPTKVKCQYKDSADLVDAGSPVWMNLSNNVFRNGDTILMANTDEAWHEASTNNIPAMRIFHVPGDSGTTQYAVYDRAAIEDPRNLAPEGWHVITLDELMNRNSVLSYLIRHDTAIIYKHDRKHKLHLGITEYNRCWVKEVPKTRGALGVAIILKGGSFVFSDPKTIKGSKSVLCIKDNVTVGN